jgi:hypothetical protein
MTLHCVADHTGLDRLLDYTRELNHIDTYEDDFTILDIAFV